MHLEKVDNEEEKYEELETGNIEERYNRALNRKVLHN